MSGLKDFLMAPLALLYTMIYLLRWILYRLGLFKKIRLKIPVLSVGNLTMGGSGKTPFMIYLLKNWKRGPVGVVCRSYKAKAREPSLLLGQGSLDPHIFGDEACLLKTKFPDVQVMAGPQKAQSAAALVQQGGSLSAVLVDDGFQHWKLHRDMDIVLLDATENEKDWLIVPVGAAREPFAALSRADVLVLTKTNLASPEDLQRIYQRVDRFLVKDRRPLICESQHVLTGFRNLETHQSVEKIAEGPVVLVSGIAKPRQFEALLAAAGVGPVLYHHQLGDHEGLNPGSLRTLEKKCSELGCRRLVLTEKDAVKWKTSGFEVWAAGLELQVTKNERELWNALDRHFV